MASQNKLHKTDCSVLDVANRKVNMQKRRKFDPHPVNLGDTLARSLTFSIRLMKVAQKINARVNLMKKLVGTDRGTDFKTPQTSTIALVNSAADYACPVWSHSTHTKHVEVQ